MSGNLEYVGSAFNDISISQMLRQLHYLLIWSRMCFKPQTFFNMNMGDK